MGLTNVANGVFVVRFVVLAELVLLPPLLDAADTAVLDAGVVTVACCGWLLAVSEVSETDETDETWLGCF